MGHPVSMSKSSKREKSGTACFCHAMNTIVGFDVSDIMVLHDKEDAVLLCEKLNQDEGSLIKYCFEVFELLGKLLH